MRMKASLIAVLLSVLSGQTASATEVASPDKCGEVKLVLVSWYGGKFHGRLTANGEKYDQHALTAAHVTLEMGTLVRFTNPRNRRRVDVRINDRGPYATDAATGKKIPHPIRTFDLSKAAAARLRIRGRGTAWVHSQVLCP